MNTPYGVWYFDFISPFAYLQWCDFKARPLAVELRPRAILFAGLLKHYGHKGPAEIPAKRTHTYRYCHWLAGTSGVGFRMPPAHPFRPLPALRLAIACDHSAAVIDAIFRAIWEQGKDPNTPAVWDELCAASALTNAKQRIEDADVKALLRQNTDEAIKAGVFGVPTVAINGQLFWGYDGSDFVRAYIADPTLFDSAEMQRIDSLPAAVQRPV